MYGIFAYIWLIFMASVGKYTIHGSYGLFKKTSAGRVRRRGTALTSQRQQRKPLHVSWQFAKTVLNLYAYSWANDPI